SPKELHVKNDSYQFDFVPEVTGNIIRLRYYYKTFKDHIPAKETQQYKSDYKKIADKFDFSLYYSGDAIIPAAGNNTETLKNININWLMVLLAMLICGGMILLMRYLNKKDAPVYYIPETGLALGGWVIVLGITLGLSGIVQIVYFVQNEYFSGASWKALEENGGAKMQFVAFIEMAFDLIWISGVVALFYWFLLRLDIFPRMFIGYVGTLLLGQLILLTLYNSIHYPASFGDMQTPVLKQILRTGIYGAIWVTYVVRSERVKSTFLQPYK
ncbi:MAG: DUF2569 domain-containing protein, partial [Bacteroidota bacterium]